MTDASLVAFLREAEVLGALPQEDLEELSRQARVSAHDFGATIAEEGAPSEGLYLVRTGRVRLFKTERGKEKSVDTRGQGDTFGEAGALKQQPFEYSVRASAKTEVVLIPRQALGHVLGRNQAAQHFFNRYTLVRLTGGLVSQLFDLKGKVDRAALEEIISGLGVKRVAGGETILEQDATEDRRLYFVRAGRVELLRREEGREMSLGLLEEGQPFGEKACLMLAPQPLRAVAREDAVLLVISQATVGLILERNPSLRQVLEERIAFQEKEMDRQRRLAEKRSARALFDLSSRPRPGERIIRRFQLVEQAEEMDCGAACLSMLCKHYKISMSLGKLREMANVTREGATMESLAKAGESLGFTVKGVRANYNSLKEFGLPFIAHWEGYHYIVVYGLSHSHVWVADPALGFRKLTRQDFEQGWTGNCLLFQFLGMESDLVAATSPWRRFIGYVLPFKRILGDLLLAALVVQLLGLATPLMIQNILDRVVVHDNIHLLNLMVLGLALSLLFSEVTVLASAYLSNHMVRKMDFNMMARFYRHVLALPLSFFANRQTGDIMARFRENRTVREFMTKTSINTVLNTLMVFVYFCVMFFYNVKLTLLLMLFMPPILLLVALATPKFKSYARQIFYSETEAESLLVETLSASETAKGMGIERPLRLKWEGRYAKSLDIKYRAEMFASKVGLLGALLKGGATLTLLWIGTNLVLAHELTIGQLMAFNVLIGSAMGPLLGLVGVWDEFQETMVAMERLGDVLDLEPEQRPQDIASRVVLPDLKGRFRLEGVYFRYGGAESSYVLKNIDLTIEAGSTVAIVGPSGSGKTTLAKLLVGFNKPTEGAIYVDGYDLNSLELEYYRAQVGYVMQSNLLFSGSIAENIAAGEANPDRKRIEEVAKLADAHGFISNLPMGYEQLVGERGVGLSGGQIQRICIARALYRDPRVIILDEATSSLDTESESHIQSNLRAILQGRTAVIIAHRLSTIRHADTIMVLYDGAIVEKGSHDELVAKKGMYCNLVQKQMASGELKE